MPLEEEQEVDMNEDSFLNADAAEDEAELFSAPVAVASSSGASLGTLSFSGPKQVQMIDMMGNSNLDFVDSDNNNNQQQQQQQKQIVTLSQQQRGEANGIDGLLLSSDNNNKKQQARGNGSEP